MHKLLPSFFLYVLLILTIQVYPQQFNRIDNVANLGEVVANNGVSVADYDQDNDLDLFIVTASTDEEGNPYSQSKLFRNDNNGRFTDVTLQAGIENLLFENEIDPSIGTFYGLLGFKFGASWGDYNNDSFPDLFLTSLAKVHLFKNNGDGTFTDVTQQSGIQQSTLCGHTGATWFDYDNDGFLDLYISEWRECSFNTFYKNNGDGTFSDVSSLIIDDEEFLPSFVAFPFDFNNDGFQDLYISNDLLELNQLFINSQDSFQDNAIDYGLDSRIYDMGITMSDFNLDGLFDLYITGIDKNSLFENQGEQAYLDVSVENNVNRTGWAWGCKFADFDLDGDEDLVVVNGSSLSNFRSEKNIYFENLYANDGNTFSEIDVGLDEIEISVEVIDFDYDNDGDLDLYITNSIGQSYLYENDVIHYQNTQDDLKWLKINLEGTISNRDAIGTVVNLYTTNGVLKRYYSGVGFLGQSLQPVHFGIPSNSTIEKIIIEWPSGLTEEYSELETNTFLKAVENVGLTVLDNNTADKSQGCTDPSSCNYDPNAIVDDGSCEYLPSNYFIQGNTVTQYFAENTYQINLEPNLSVGWEVTNGEIIEINGNSITVKWGLEQEATISAVISNDFCSSTEISLPIRLSYSNSNEEISIARIWNEATLFAIRNDFARPTVHARNLFFTSAAMYDAWAIFNNSKPYLMGNELNGYLSQSFYYPVDESNRLFDSHEAISHAAYRLLTHRFQSSPNAQLTLRKFDELMDEFNYDRTNQSIDFSSGDPAALGNYIAQIYIAYGLIDGSREDQEYTNEFYQPVNPPLAPSLPGNPTLVDPDRWQSLSLDTFIDQGGNVIEGESIDFLSPEWGSVFPFALTNEDAITNNRNGFNYTIYHDPGSPPTTTENIAQYIWGFTLVAKWSAHLDPTDDVYWDISPNSIGNINIDDAPSSYSQFNQFYNEDEGGAISQGYFGNPISNRLYDLQIVPRGDYTRVVAEFWADGPDSETPPGHWFSIFNSISDHPLLVKKIEGEGEEVSALEWDIKSYFTLGGAMHDAAISAWSVKGWYDYLRPISAIRYMADQGQSSDPSLPNYHIHGLPLQDGFLELVEENDSLAGSNNEHVGKVKLYAWRGHDQIFDPQTDQAGVGWILAENWWPYQRPSFVTPPFAGFVSGHSTYSRAAAEVLETLTGSPFFPGGLGEFIAPKDSFLVFEKGPSIDVILQWATYADAADQSALSRIWGGIHPPADDLPGRKMGKVIGQDAVNKALSYFIYHEQDPLDLLANERLVYPNPVKQGEQLIIANIDHSAPVELFDMFGRPVAIQLDLTIFGQIRVQLQNAAAGSYILLAGDNHWLIIVE